MSDLCMFDFHSVLSINNLQDGLLTKDRQERRDEGGPSGDLWMESLFLGIFGETYSFCLYQVISNAIRHALVVCYSV